MSAAPAHRFFVSAESLVAGQFSSTDPELTQQLTRVLRLTAGDAVTLLTGDGQQHVVLLTEVTRNALRGAVTATQPVPSEPRAHITLGIALIRPERVEWALQKGTEIGAAAFVPVITERTRAQDASGSRLERWRRLVREAAEQSERGVLPQVSAPQPLAVVLARPAATLILSERGGAPIRAALSRDAAGPWQILSGPEGGWTAAELAAAASAGATAISLGPRILRAETAPLVALSLVLHELGEL